MNETLPGCEASITEAVRHLSECLNQFTKDGDLVAALTSANIAQLAVSLLIIDLELKLRDQPPRKEEVRVEPPKKRSRYRPDDETVAEWVKERYAADFYSGSDLQQRGWRANYVIAQRRKEIAA